MDEQMKFELDAVIERLKGNGYTDREITQWLSMEDSGKAKLIEDKRVNA